MGEDRWKLLKRIVYTGKNRIRLYEMRISQKMQVKVNSRNEQRRFRKGLGRRAKKRREKQ